MSHSAMRPMSVRGLETRIRRLAFITKVTDTAITVPGTDVKLGLDAVIGAVPLAGDLVMAGVAMVMIYDAQKLGVPRRDLMVMVRNVALDTTLGAMPFIGDLFDLVYRSNERNLKIIERHIGRIDAAVVDVTP